MPGVASDPKRGGGWSHGRPEARWANQSLPNRRASLAKMKKKMKKRRKRRKKKKKKRKRKKKKKKKKQKQKRKKKKRKRRSLLLRFLYIQTPDQPL